jgi:hypothetical protein
MERLSKCGKTYSFNWYNIKGYGNKVCQNAEEKFRFCPRKRQEYLKKEK